MVGKEGGDTGMPMADSCWGMAKPITVLKKKKKKKKKKKQEKVNSTTADNELWRIFINSIMLLQHFNMFWKTGLLFSINIKYF